MLTESTRRSGNDSLFQARGAATANERSPSDDVVRGTATEPDVADLRPALAVVAADGLIRSAMQITWCFAVQATVNSHAQLVLSALLDRKPMMTAKQTSNVVQPGRAGDQTNGRFENGLQALNVAVGETSEYNVRYSSRTDCVIIIIIIIIRNLYSAICR